MAEVLLKNIVKDFGKTRIIKNVSLEIESNKLTVFVGPSGCGKSTLLRMIAGLEVPTTGEIWIGGKLVNDIAPARRGVAMVFQSYALYPHMTVYDNIAFGLISSGHTKAEIDQRIQKAANMLGLKDLLKRMPKELSGGQRQRVAMGRAIVRRPSVFLFDEPLSNLDAALRLRMRVEIAKLRHELNATMVYVTHDQVEAMTLADKIVVLRDGQIEQIGKPLEVYKSPANKFVAGFLGAPSMNFISAKVADFQKGNLGVRLPNGAVIEVKAQSSNISKDANIDFGIRPEHFKFKGETPYQFEAKVDAVERLGDHNLVYLNLGASAEESFVAKLPADLEVSPQAKLKLGFDPADCHLFDSSGKTISV